MGIFGNKFEGVNLRAKDLEEEKYGKGGGIAGDGFYDENETHFGQETRDLATGDPIDNSTETGFESLSSADASTLERQQEFVSRYEAGDNLSPAEIDEIKHLI